jgi:hypothetical protein
MRAVGLQCRRETRNEPSEGCRGGSTGRKLMMQRTKCQSTAHCLSGPKNGKHDENKIEIAIIFSQFRALSVTIHITADSFQVAALVGDGLRHMCENFIL